MHSSTSNSKLIRNSLVVLVGLILAYCVAVESWIRPDSTAIIAGQDQWQENIIRAEHYMYSSRKWPVVIVGSSMTARLDPDTLPPGYYNLAFHGRTSSSGLGILLRSLDLPTTEKPEKAPQLTVLVEMNSPLRDDLEFLSIFDPIGYRLKKWIPALREEYQPGTLINYFLKTKSKLSTPLQAQPELVKELVAKLQIKFQTPEKEAFQDGMKVVREQVTRLQAKGVRVLFFQMPIDTKLMDSPRVVQGRRQVESTFPDISWVSGSPTLKLDTTDGLHLTPDSAKAFAEDFTRALGLQLHSN